MNWKDFSIYAQLLLTIYFIVTHWIPMSPWNNINKVDFKLESIVNFIIHILQVVLIVGTNQNIAWIKVMTVVFYSVWIVGHIVVWWIPYIFGAPKTFMEIANTSTKDTISFLPKIKNHSVPDACHFFIGLLTIPVIICVWMNLIT